MRRILTDNIGLKLFSLFVAVLLWASVKGGEEREGVLVLSVEPINLPPNLVVVNDIPKDLRIKVRGPRMRIEKLIKEYPRVYPLDLSNAVPGRHTYPVNLEDAVGKMPPGVKVTHLDPYLFRVHVAKRGRKNVPVRLDIVGRPSPPFKVGKINYDPKEVTISGPESEIRKLRKVETVPIDLNGVEHTVNGKFGLKPFNSDSKIRVEGPALVYIEIEIIEEKPRDDKRRFKRKKR